MSGNTNFFSGKLVPALNSISSKPFVKAMQTGMTAPMVATVVGSIFTVLKTPPAPVNSTNSFIVLWRQWSEVNDSWLSLGVSLTINAVGLYALVGFVIDYALRKKAKPINMLVLSMIVFFTLCSQVSEGMLSMDNLGAKGLFPAVLIGYCTVTFGKFLLDKGLQVKLPSTVPPNVAEPIQALFMNIIIIFITFIIKIILDNFNLNLPELINGLFSPLFIAGDSLLAVVLSMFLIRLLWFFGLHGGNIGGIILTPFLTTTMVENMDAYAKGEPLPHIFTLVFNQAWGVIGMLAICISILLVCKSKQLKAISAIGFVPALFNIGEPLTFGLPIVLNFHIVVPYLIGFSLNGGVAYLATKWGFMGRTFINVPQTVPAIFKVFLANLDWRSIIVYIALMAFDIILFIPFLKKYDNELVQKEMEDELQGIKIV